ncbi:MAG: endonuclease Q family protein [Candidatus Beckwithbacteria bacterium]|nr:endonuclease Q family protein [Candidatus Beckwithbacteria bacterium]
MQIVADLHLHSKYSRAVSPEMMTSVMAKWAEKKGIDLLATSDWTHPLWLKELETFLEEDGEGIFKVKNSPSKTRFLLSTEIANIYTDKNKGRRIHTLFWSPSFQTVHKINEELAKRGGNLLSDGRPILGLTLKQMCEVVWGIDERVLVVPAHAWTPWFAIFGSKSGFDSIEEAFGEFSDRIYAVETGLSSDPLMNWRIKDLEKRAIVSFSDSHSPRKMGREATVFEFSGDKLKFDDIAGAIKQDKDSRCRIAYTIEFHPEEGKYHYTGHRACGVVQSPEETRKNGTTCHVCGRPLTVGVMHRVDELDQVNKELKAIEKSSEAGVVGYYHPTDKSRPPYVMLVPLGEILAESLGTNTASKRVDEMYEKMISVLGNELDILLKKDLQEISKIAGEKVAEGVAKVRSGKIVINPGYDGVFGVVKIWGSLKEINDDKLKSEQPSLF